VFAKSAAFYDAVYAAKDYAGEAERIDALIKTHVRTSGKTLLDVACGTGGHLAYLKHYYVSEGLDLDPNLLATARERHPELQVLVQVQRTCQCTHSSSTGVSDAPHNEQPDMQATRARYPECPRYQRAEEVQSRCARERLPFRCHISAIEESRRHERYHPL
jgi:SAM-dependent methyltransferase